MHTCNIVIVLQMKPRYIRAFKTPYSLESSPKPLYTGCNVSLIHPNYHCRKKLPLLLSLFF